VEEVGATRLKQREREPEGSAVPGQQNQIKNDGHGEEEHQRDKGERTGVGISEQ